MPSPNSKRPDSKQRQTSFDKEVADSESLQDGAWDSEASSGDESDFDLSGEGEELAKLGNMSVDFDVDELMFA